MTDQVEFTIEPELSIAEYEARLEALTPRQREVVDMLARGLDAVEIAAELGISRWTVHNHAKEAAQRLGVQGCRARITAFLVFGAR
jgi:DNA-binding NarL/FixJ family response regulator